MYRDIICTEEYFQDEYFQFTFLCSRFSLVFTLNFSTIYIFYASNFNLFLQFTFASIPALQLRM